MVASCCAYGCNERASSKSQVTFHSFPKDEARRKLWYVKLRRKNFEVTKHTKICSKHFTSDSFDTEKFGGTWLKNTAVPTLFDFPDHLLLKTVERNPLSKRIIFPPQPQDIIPPLPQSNKKLKRKHYIGDFEDEDMICPDNACHVLRIAKAQYVKDRHKIKCLNLKNKRLEKRICSLKEILAEMKKKVLISQSGRNNLKLGFPDLDVDFDSDKDHSDADENDLEI